MKCIGCILAGSLAALIVAASGCTEATSPAPVAQVTEDQVAPVAVAPHSAAPVTTEQPADPLPAAATAQDEPAQPAEVADERPAPSASPAPDQVAVVPVKADRFTRPPLPNEPPPGPKVVRPKVAKGASGLDEITFDAIKFDIEKDGKFERGMIPQNIEDLTGKRIRIYGYMLPTSVFQQTGIQQFILVRDNQECCFGPGAALYDCIVVKMNPGRTTDFAVLPIAVEGTFTIDEMRLNGKTMAIYHLDGESAK